MTADGQIEVHLENGEICNSVDNKNKEKEMYVFLIKYSNIEVDAKDKKKQAPCIVKRKILNINCNFKIN